MRKKLSHLTYTRLLAVGCGCVVGAFLIGCASPLFERIPGTDDVRPSPKIVHAIEDTGKAFGPWGELGAGVAVLALGSASHLMNKRNIRSALTQHAQDFHTVTPPRAQMLTPAPNRDAPGIP